MVIDPKIIYLCYVFDEIRNLLIAIMVIGFGMDFFNIIVAAATVQWDKLNTRIAVITTSIIFICAVGLIIIPERTTYCGMVAASYLTTDNLNAVPDGGKELVDYIFDRMGGTDE